MSENKNGLSCGKVVLLSVAVFLLVSCSAGIDREVTVSLFSDLTWEQVTGESMWYKFRYFDGESVHTEYLSAGESEITVTVSPTSLAVFALYPLGDLSPFGGFWEGGERNVYLDAQSGYFAQMLIEAAETMPHAVREVSVEAIREYNPDLGAVRRDTFLTSLYAGTLEEGKLTLSKKFSVPLDGVLPGYWVSLFSHSSSFTLSGTGDGKTVSLLPGIWYYLNTERKMILEIVISDEGEYWVKHKAQPKWS